MMKHLIYFMLLITGAVFTASCSSNDNYDEYVNNTSSVTIVKSDVIFDANANTGTVVYNAPGTVEAVSSSDWMTASVNGNTVTVNVEPNGSSEGRAALLTLKYGKDVARVTVQQTGVTFKYSIDGGVICGDTATVRTYPISLAGDLTLWSDVDWLSASASRTELTVNIAENKTGSRRSAWLHFRAGVTEDSIFVDQHDFDNSMLGEYLLHYNTNKTITVTLRKNEAKKYEVLFNSSGYVMPVDCDPINFKLTITNLAPMEGTYTKSGVDYSVMAMINYTNGSSVYRKNDTGILLLGNYEEVEGKTYWVFEFDPNDIIDKTAYQYYAFRIAYTTGGYEGYKGAVTTYAYMDYWQKK